MVMKSSVFWDITQCSPLKVNRCVWGICRLHLQGWRISQARNQCESRWQAYLCYETSVDIKRTARRYVPEDRALPFHIITVSNCLLMSQFTRVRRGLLRNIFQELVPGNWTLHPAAMSDILELHEPCDSLSSHAGSSASLPLRSWDSSLVSVLNFSLNKCH
jgi:hypothetical protein